MQGFPLDAQTVFILQSTPLYCVQTMESDPMDMFPTGTVVRFMRVPYWWWMVRQDAVLLLHLVTPGWHRL